MELIINEYPSLNIFYTVIKNINNKKRECGFIREIEEEVRKLWNREKLLSNEIIRAYRDFFWEIGIDPTKERPSSEALIRRLLRGKSLPRINPAVDAMNAASVKTLITFGLFDFDRLKFPLELKPAEGKEDLVIIGGKRITVPKNFPIIRDGSGKVISATIYRDGEYAKVTEETKNLFLVSYGPPGIDLPYLRKAVKVAEQFIKKC